MFIFGYLIDAVATVIDMILNIYMLIVILNAIISWINPDPYNPIVRFINNATEPVLYRIRKTIPTVYGGFDFSPIIVLIAIVFLQNFVVRSLHRLAATFM